MNEVQISRTFDFIHQLTFGLSSVLVVKGTLIAGSLHKNFCKEKTVSTASSRLKSSLSAQVIIFHPKKREYSSKKKV